MVERDEDEHAGKQAGFVIDWAQISILFDIRVAALDCIDTPPQELLERHKAHLLTGGLVPSPLKHPAFDQWYTDPGSTAWMTRARELESEIRRGRVSLNSEPDDISAAQDLQRFSDWKEAIQAGIEHQEVSTKFLEAWLLLGELCGRHSEIGIVADAAKSAREREVNSGIAVDSTARFCWLAYWLDVRKAIDSPVRRHDAQTEVFDLITRISLGELNSSRNPDHYGAKWFCRLLMYKNEPLPVGKEPKKKYKLTESFTRLGPAQIRRYLAHPYITRDSLPPLHAKDFDPGCKP